MSSNDERERTMTLRQADIIERRETNRPGKNTEAELATLKLSEAQLDALIGKDGASTEDLFREADEDQEDASKLPTKEFVLEASVMSHLSNPMLELPPLEDVGKDETARINEGVLKRTIAASKQEEGIGGEGATRELKTPNALPSRLLNAPPKATTSDQADFSNAPGSRLAPREETVRVEFSNAESKPLPNAGLKKTRERLLFIGIGGLALTLGGLVTVLLFMLFRS